MAAPVTPGKAKTIWQPQFVRLVAEGTGISQLVIWAWLLAEGGPPHNPLNIGPGRNYGDHRKAAQATIELLRHSRYAPILRAARTGGDQDVIAAIVASPWDAGHYRGGDLLRGTYQRAQREHPGAGGGGRVGEAVEGAIVEPIERAAASVETFLVDRAKLSLAYVGLTAASVVLFIIGLQLATGVPGTARQLGLAAATRGRSGGEIPF